MDNINFYSFFFNSFPLNQNKNLLNRLKTLDQYNKNFVNRFENVGINDIDVWKRRISVIQNYGLTDNKNMKILDVGVLFGIIPDALLRHGYNNVHTTESMYYATGKIPELKLIWDEYGLSPYDLTIKPRTLFELPETYDLILILHTDIFSKNDNIYHFNGATGTIEKNNTLQYDNQHHTFIHAYDYDDWVFFLNNLKEYLAPGGTAIINPYPWVYDSDSKIERLFSRFKIISNDQLDEDCDYDSLDKYLIISKDALNE